MANEEQLSILKQGIEVWNRWRQENPEMEVGEANLGAANLRGADLRGADLRGVDLMLADLCGANLEGVDCKSANLKFAKLQLTNLKGADCRAADFSGADLRRADLSTGRLEEADLSAANLSGVNLSKATIRTTVFISSDLSDVLGLEDLVHRGPSTIGLDSIAKSKGKIPEVFLRGCGLSDWEIEVVKLYDPDLSNDEFINIQNRIFDIRQRQAIQVSPLFISYSHTDGRFADRIGDGLTEKGVRYWRDIKDLKAGRVEKQLDRAIRQNPTVLLILSEHSLNSDWVEHEVRRARALEKEMGRDVLCPVALDHSWKSSHWPKRIMEQIMEYNILDFSGWEDDVKFEGMFRKLIEGLELFYKG